jgi:hypothetical protein
MRKELKTKRIKDRRRSGNEGLNYGGTEHGRYIG